MPLTLVIEEPSGRRWTKQVHGTLIIGRDPKVAQLVLQDDYVSRNHATITRRSSGQWLYIHHGRNASRLDDAVITGLREQALIRDQSRLRLGSYRVTFISDEEPATEILASRHLANPVDFDDEPIQLEPVIPRPNAVDSGLSSGPALDENSLEVTMVEVPLPGYVPGEPPAAAAGAVRTSKVERVQLQGLEAQAPDPGSASTALPASTPGSGQLGIRVPSTDASAIPPVPPGPGAFETMDYSEHAVRLRAQHDAAPTGLARLTRALQAWWQRLWHRR